MSTPETKVPISDAEKQELMRKLEKEGEEKVKRLDASKQAITADTFKDIIKEGMSEFEAKVGRPMTYSEMREAYG